MSIESAKAYVEKVKSDQEFAQRVSEAASSQERAEIAKSEGFDFTPEEIKSVTGDLSDEELEAVAGGDWCSQEPFCPLDGHCGVTHESECD